MGRQHLRSTVAAPSFSPDLLNRSVAQLRQLARQLGVRSYTRMARTELVQVLDQLQPLPAERLYPISAVAADGEQRRSIRMEFQRSTPEARVNSRQEAQPACF